jgi:hypothetical protein
MIDVDEESLVRYMISVDESVVRYQARRRGYQMMRVRGRELARREAAGVGHYMLTEPTGVVLFEATLEGIAAFLSSNRHESRLN